MSSSIDTLETRAASTLSIDSTGMVTAGAAHNPPGLLPGGALLADSAAEGVAVLHSDGTLVPTLLAAGYRRGTRIRSEAGDKAIESLRVGELVLTGAGSWQAVRWLAWRTIDCERTPDPSRVWPVRIAASALAPLVPARDLWVSPDQPLLLGKVPIPAEKLVNGSTIVREPSARVEYWHLELDQPASVIAEGLPTPTTLDSDPTADFLTGDEYLANEMLLEHARALGFELTSDPDVHLLADGLRIDPLMISNTRFAFTVPSVCVTIELRSRTFVPAQVNPALTDTRTLGVCIGRLQLNGEEQPLDDPTLTEGWHDIESVANGQRQRWTRGTTPLPAATHLVLVDLVARSAYWRPAAPVPLASAG